MSLWTSTSIAAATGGTPSRDFAASGVAFDSREIGPGDLFVAMPGTASDGHGFVAQAFARGAAGAVVSRPVDGPHVLVPDTAAALEALGRTARARTSARIAGVTGSVGKTGTKEALAAALARTPGTRVHRSVKSYNNHTGVPLSLARMPADSDFGVFEMGMNHAGEIAGLAAQVRPHVALVTAIAPAHIEFFASVEAIADAKGEIFGGLEPDGTAVIPFDSPHRDRLIGHARRADARVMTFGSGDGADVRARNAVELVDGTRASVDLPGGSLQLTIGQPGAHWLSNGLAVIAAIHALGADVGVAALALADLAGLPGRGARSRVRVGDGSSDGEALVIDESYNANPTSMRATLAVLARASGRKLAVLGAMRELGADADRLHAELAEPVLASGAAFALLVGDGMQPLGEALEGQTEVLHVPDAGAARDVIRDRLRAGDTVLVKGSNSVGLAAVVADLQRGLQQGEDG